MIRYIPIDEIPITILVPLRNIDYELSFQYNARFNFVTVSIYKDGVLLHSTKVVYGNNLVFGIQDKDIPNLIPLTEADLSTDTFADISVNKDTLGKTVFIYFDDGSNV
jgi:hypothetical protein